MVGVASLDVLLGIVPGTASVGHGHSKLHTGHQGACQGASQGLGAEEGTDHDRCEHNQGTRGDHLSQGGGGGDLHALLVVGAGCALHQTIDGVELAADLLHHGQSSLAHTLHGHGREPVGEHSTKQQASKHLGVQDGGVDQINLGASDVCTEQGQRHQSGGTNGETLADGSGGVAGSVQGISALTDVLTHASHLSNATSVIRDRTVGINSQTSGQGAKHAQGSSSNAVHASQAVADVDAHGHDDGGDDGGLVAQGQTKDDVSGRASAAGISNVLHRLVPVAGEVLSLQTNEETTPQTNGDGDKHVPVLDNLGVEGLLGVGTGHLQGELLRQSSNGHEVGNRGHQHGGDNELHLQGMLDLSDDLGGLQVGGDEGCGNADQDTSSTDQQREGHADEVMAGTQGGDSGHDESSASGLSE
mmetsp:Transcript_1004/g.2179  ORF Transcript_1004/g.2179 Transcript_1004/m.2179 type:complete len:416 (-) Transcript_1004:987-2234(-)